MSESDFAVGFKQGRAVEHSVMLEEIEDIKAEIKEQMDDDDYFCGLSLALQIIDKHIGKAESEEV